MKSINLGSKDGENLISKLGLLGADTNNQEKRGKSEESLSRKSVDKEIMNK